MYRYMTVNEGEKRHKYWKFSDEKVVQEHAKN